MGSVNNPVCWSFIQHLAEGKKKYILTFCELQKAVISLLKANTTRECPFTTCLKELISRPNVQKDMKSNLHCDGKLLVHKAQCDQLMG